MSNAAKTKRDATEETGAPATVLHGAVLGRTPRAAMSARAPRKAFIFG